MIDLHTHSIFSDGTLSPTELIRLSQDVGLTAVALCDHNTVAGLPEFLEAARGSGVTAIPGVEFSTDFEGTELHILGLLVEPKDYAPITQMLEEMLLRKEQSNIALVEALSGADIHLDYARIKAGTPNGQVNRAVIAAEMVRLGYCDSVKEAFSRWLSPKHGYFQPPRRPDAFAVIRFIKSLGAVAVLAHPFLNLDEAGLRRFLPVAVECGLDGMEVYYPKFDESQRTLAASLAAEFGLLESGGSDFHGANKPDIHLGTGKNNLEIPEKILEALRMKKM